MKDLHQVFDRHFSIKTNPAADVQDEAFKLRYQVYCVERGFESEARCIGRREQDRFDSNSLHGIVQHRDTGNTMATVRLVRLCQSAPEQGFPLEQAFPDLLCRHGLSDSVLPRQTTAEISRFAISKASQDDLLRRSDGRQTTPLSRSGACFKGRYYPLLTFGLFAALMRLSAHNEITHWLAIMAPSLLRLLRRFGIAFNTIGGLVDYHGYRQPCYGRVADIRDGVRDAEQDLFELAQQQSGISLVGARESVSRIGARR